MLKNAMKYILETERLSLREFTINDTAFIIELVNTPGWIAFIGDRNIKTTEQAKEYLQNGPMKSYELNGFGLSLVEIKTNKTAIGMCGIIKRDNLENPDIGFAFLPQFTGKGFAFEIANATMNYASDILKLPTVFAITIPSNERSIKLLEKIGLKFRQLFIFPGEKEELMLFSN
ncbi:MAG: GNAT family N-acetyltransferase [Ferruginibacter sp.]